MHTDHVGKVQEQLGGALGLVALKVEELGGMLLDEARGDVARKELWVPAGRGSVATKEDTSHL
eukprot:scaffold236391_cov19-Tisochrysis_lutea.AAC.1